jgi:GNAT superfamily N-acetyltransferase
LVSAQGIWPRILRGPVGKQEYVALVRDVAVPAVPPRLPFQVIVRIATSDDFPALEHIMHSQSYVGLSLTQAGLARRFDAGDACVVITSRGDIAAFSWIRFDNGSFNSKWLSLPLHQGEAYIHNTFTRPSYRGQGLATLLSVERLSWLRGRGVRVAYSWIAPANPMRTVAARTGSIEVGQVTQHYLRGVRKPVLNTITIFDPPHPLAGWCSPARMRFPSGLVHVHHDRAPSLESNTA